ncbi:hypothetical protein NDU88_000235 [Pleurodeles waltl]|uniref:Uncharacterized protein n=1 Tax=Pleurodeles waltl TaxID=8319 RepID=A0AAV7KSZ1_PLEWA|nr:hypothetical protein NDU88_000235 [Pleurodeles waltl]
MPGMRHITTHEPITQCSSMQHARRGVTVPAAGDLRCIKEAVRGVCDANAPLLPDSAPSQWGRAALLPGSPSSGPWVPGHQRCCPLKQSVAPSRQRALRGGPDSAVHSICGVWTCKGPSPSNMASPQSLCGAPSRQRALRSGPVHADNPTHMGTGPPRRQQPRYWDEGFQMVLCDRTRGPE